MWSSNGMFGVQAWGVCAEKYKLPGSGFEYDADALIRIRSLPFAALFAEHEGCGTAPFVVRGNTAGNYGGGLFQQVCMHVCMHGLIHVSTHLYFSFHFHRHATTDWSRKSCVG